MTVVDVDRPDAVGDTQLSATFTVSTPGGAGREHRYYTGSTSIRTWAAGEVRSQNRGYVVGPGSVTPAGRYEITSKRKPAKMPTWLDDVVVDVDFSQARPAPRDRIPQGTHDAMLYELARHSVKRQNLTVEATLPLLDALASTFDQDERNPYTERDFVRIAESAERGEAWHDKQAPELDETGLVAMEEWLTSAAENVPALWGVG